MVACESLSGGCDHRDQGVRAGRTCAALGPFCPDLVVSGVNFGPNLGLGLHASGTVGAALIGLLHGLPAIAVSAGMLFEEAAQNPKTFPRPGNNSDACWKPETWDWSNTGP